MKAKIYIFTILFLPLVVSAQQQVWPNYQANADSIVSHFLSEPIFRQFVESKGSSRGKYRFQFDHSRAGIAFGIFVALDTNGYFLPNKETRGLIKIDSLNDANWITARQAYMICKDQSYRLKKKSLRLTWDTTNVSYDLFLKTRNFRDIMPGDLVWEIDGKVKFRGNVYSGTFQVNVFTGVVARRFAIPWD